MTIASLTTEEACVDNIVTFFELVTTTQDTTAVDALGMSNADVD